MKTALSILFFFLFVNTFAQQAETKFLERKSVRWAAYISDTFRFSNPNLSAEIRSQLLEGKIRFTRPGSDDHVYFNDPVKIDELIGSTYGTNCGSYDSLGNLLYTAPPTPTVQQFLFDSIKFDQFTHNLMEVEQVVYFENNVLKHHVSFVSVIYNVVTPQGTNIGKTRLLNTYYNRSEEIKSSTKKNSIALGYTSRILTDSFLSKNMIKQWYGENLVKAIWPGLTNKNVEIIRLDSSIKISLSELNENIWNKSRVPVPVYDSLGNLSGSRIENMPLDIAVFDKVEIVQEWFYNPSKQVVWNNITSLTLYAPKFVKGEFEASSSPLLKIIYK